MNHGKQQICITPLILLMSLLSGEKKREKENGDEN